MKNLKKAPQIIIDSKSICNVLDYKWDDQVMEKLLDPAELNDELEIALNRISHKASLGLSAALLEWIYWRFTNYTTMSDDISQRIESLWCSVENPENTTPLLFDENLDIQASGYIKGPIWIALMNVRIIDVMYRKGSHLLQSELVGLVLLTRHITPKKRIFDKWFNNTLADLIDLFPNQNNQIDISEDDVYDFSSESAICRDFFFNPYFKYSDESSKLALNEFITNVNYKTNHFCVAK